MSSLEIDTAVGNVPVMLGGDVVMPAGDVDSPVTAGSEDGAEGLEFGAVTRRSSSSDAGGEEDREVVSFYAGRCVFITGSTGFMGKVLVEKLLRACPHIENIYILIRPKGGKTAEQRLQSLLALKIFEELWRESPSQLEKVRAISGDMTEPELGISDADAAILEQRVSIVFHSAATVKFDEKLRLSVQMNTLGVRKIIELCKRMRKLKALVHVSTAYANCYREKIAEAVYPVSASPKQLFDALEWMTDEMLDVVTPKLIGGHPNTYTYTKALAEYLLVEEGKGLPVAIVRPSIVGASWREPLCGWIDSYNGPTGLLAAIGKGLLRTMKGKIGSTADIVPVDIPVNLMIVAGWYTAVVNSPQLTVYNCTTGASNKLTWGTMERCSYKSWMKNPQDSVIRVPNPRFTSSEWWHCLKVFFDHLLPAFLIDCCQKALGKPASLCGVYRKIHSAVNTLDFFTSREWDFTNDNTSKLMSQLTATDRSTFNFDVAELHWPTYLENYCLGTKQHLLKEALTDLPQARRHLKRMQLLTYTLNIIAFVVVWRLLIARSNLARKLWYFVTRLAVRLVKSMPMLTRS